LLEATSRGQIVSSSIATFVIQVYQPKTDKFSGAKANV